MVELRVEDSFAIPGRGLVVTGRLDGAAVTVGDRFWLCTADGPREVTVRGIERLRRCFGDRVDDGEGIGLLLRGDIPEGTVPRGTLLSSHTAR